MKVGELIDILWGLSPETEIKIGANLIREIESVDITRVAKTPKNDLYPWVAESAWDLYKVDENTAEKCVLIQVK